MKICSVCGIEKGFQEFHKHKWNKDGHYSCCKECRKIQTGKDYQNRKEYIKKQNLDYYNKNRIKRIDDFLIYQKERLKRDPAFKLSRNLRNRLWYALDHKMWKKSSKFHEYIGLVDYNDLKLYLESKFKEGMNWDNYGSYWEVDHIVPLASAETQEQMYKLCHYTNLQPLTVKDNRRKRDSR